ncbi:MAG: ADP-ribose pyrophosphatase [Candidatus Peribacteria bacterium]|nr:ADP-ribose pyrophosphatase [Candidatus Peribacteria bacterium]
MPVRKNKTDPLSSPRGVIFLLVKEKKILMQLRDAQDKRFPNQWCFPGGRCDEGEEYIHTVIREIKEEFDVNVREEDCKLLLKRLGARNWVWLCTVPEAKPVLHEGAAMQWMNLKEIQQIKLGFHQDDLLPFVEEILI